MIKISLDHKYPVRLRRNLCHTITRICKDFKRVNESFLIHITGNKLIQSLNERYLGHNYPTDVLSFSYNEHPFATCEIFACGALAKEEASLRNISADEELTRYIIHGVLHHLGLDDTTRQSKKEMFSVQEFYIEATFSDVTSSI